MWTTYFANHFDFPQQVFSAAAQYGDEARAVMFGVSNSSLEASASNIMQHIPSPSYSVLQGGGGAASHARNVSAMNSYTFAETLLSSESQFNDVPRYGAFFMGSAEAWSSTPDEFTVFYNSTAFNSAPVYLNSLYNAMLKSRLGQEQSSIQLASKVLPVSGQ